MNGNKGERSVPFASENVPPHSARSKILNTETNLLELNVGIFFTNCPVRSEARVRAGAVRVERYPHGVPSRPRHWRGCLATVAGTGVRVRVESLANL